MLTIGPIMFTFMLVPFDKYCTTVFWQLGTLFLIQVQMAPVAGRVLESRSGPEQQQQQQQQQQHKI